MRSAALRTSARAGNRRYLAPPPTQRYGVPWVIRSDERAEAREGAATTPRKARRISQVESETSRWHAWKMSLHEPPDWLLNEFSHAGRENLDAHHVSLYDSKMDASAGDELTLLRALGLGGSSTVIEFGPGTGQLAIAAARVC